jgi:hypothetical protein
MKPALAHLSPTVPAAFATAVAISLSGFLLAGAGVQGEPAPLLPAVGSAAGRVFADLPTPTHRRVAEPVTPATHSAPRRTTPTQELALQPRAVVSKPPRAHRPEPAVRRTAPPRAPVPRAPVPAPAPRGIPVVTPTFPKTPAAKGKARGHSHSRAHAPKPAAATGARAHGHGTALGHGKAHGHHHRLPPGQAKKAPAASPPAPAAPPKAHGGGPPEDDGGGNGHHGGKK